MTTVTRTTELEAVNTILSSIGEAPLNSLTGTLPVDGTTAKNVLDEICREVQSMGWHWNSHYKVDLSRDTDNKIPIGTDVLRVKLNSRYDRYSYDVVQRDNYLYNLAKNEDTFTQDFEDNDVVYLLDFSKIPEQAKRYITIRSARVFHDRTLGANTLHKFSSEDEARSLAVLKQAETETGEHNIFDSYLQSYTVNR
ncbi:tail tubular protein A [uncultured phage_Deep-GF0-KM16-C193]|uniref:Tail tubular protein A n=1 Tax=uncultured phage_Deep-GF0-KM16-C193 TaxID=2740799 RepID=A0A1B1IWP4_9CAUD|nr:tail protein [uncultured phage_Deep-GF0-KM16-C193]ANS05738.1 tail tubular protein A [uncultured phage_Deep-GF0-KM16-C193]